MNEEEEAKREKIKEIPNRKNICIYSFHGVKVDAHENGIER